MKFDDYNKCPKCSGCLTYAYDKVVCDSCSYTFSGDEIDLAIRIGYKFGRKDGLLEGYGNAIKNR